MFNVSALRSVQGSDNTGRHNNVVAVLGRPVHQCYFTALGPVYPEGNTDISTRFGLSFTRKPSFHHRKRLFLKTLKAKVEISDNAGYVLSCQPGETGF